MACRLFSPLGCTVTDVAKYGSSLDGVKRIRQKCSWCMLLTNFTPCLFLFSLLSFFFSWFFVEVFWSTPLPPPPPFFFFFFYWSLPLHLSCPPPFRSFVLLLRFLFTFSFFFFFFSSSSPHRTGTPRTQVRFPGCGRRFFSQGQLSVQTLLRCPYTPVCNRMH